MVSETKLAALTGDHHGYLVGLKRRCNAQVDAWLHSWDEGKWVDGPLGITAQERRRQPWRCRVQEVTSADAEQRVFVIDSAERRANEGSKREQAMARRWLRLTKVQARVAKGRLVDAAAIGAAAERALREHKGYGYYSWEIREGAFIFFEQPTRLAAEKRLEGRYVIATTEKDISAVEAVAHYKQLTEVESSFRNLKEVLALRPVYHQVEPRVKGHLFVAALALLLQTLWPRRLREAQVDLSATEALQAVQTIRHVTFKVNGESGRGVSVASARAQQVLRAVGITNLRPPLPPPEQPVVLS